MLQEHGGKTRGRSRKAFDISNSKQNAKDSADDSNVVSINKEK